jgi:hypothetical protein
MSRERIAGFMFGLSAGVAIGYFLLTPKHSHVSVDGRQREGAPGLTPSLERPKAVDHLPSRKFEEIPAITALH